MSFAIHRSRCKRLEEQDIRKSIEKLEEKMQSRPTQEIITNLDIEKEKLEKIRKSTIEGIITRSRAKWYEEGEESSAYFLNLERGFSEKLIASLEDGEGGFITSQNQIINKLVEYFTEMFRERPNGEDMEEFVKDIHIKQKTAVKIFFLKDQ